MGYAAPTACLNVSEAMVSDLRSEANASGLCSEDAKTCLPFCPPGQFLQGARCELCTACADEGLFESEACTRLSDAVCITLADKVAQVSCGETVLLSSDRYFGASAREIVFKNNTVTFKGAGRGQYVVIDSAGQGTRFLSLLEGSKVTLIGVHLINGHAGLPETDSESSRRSESGQQPAGGGAVWVSGASTLTLIDSRISQSTTSGSGGAVVVDSDSTLIVSGSSVIESGVAQVDGGCVLAVDAHVHIRDASMLRNCSAAANGGAVSCLLVCTPIWRPDTSVLEERITNEVFCFEVLEQKAVHAYILVLRLLACVCSTPWLLQASTLNGNYSCHANISRTNKNIAPQHSQLRSALEDSLRLFVAKDTSCDFHNVI
jgi:hypothetical protein